MNEFFADNVACTQVVRKRQPVYLQGDPAESVYLLQTGRVKISSHAESGKEVTLALLKPGALFGVVEAFDGTLHETNAEALEDAVVATIPRAHFVKRLRENPGLAMELTQRLLFIVRTLQRRVQDLVLRDATARLARVLIDLGGAAGSPDRQALRIDPKLTHQEIANIVGCTRETVSTILGQFRGQGWITMHRGSITLLNPEAVARLVAYPVPTWSGRPCRRAYWPISLRRPGR